jgi:predicted nucleotidyltransferase
MSTPLLNLIRAQSAELCQRYGVRRLGIFGSVARGEEQGGSDIDFLAEFESPNPAGMADRYFGFIADASSRFGRPVQVLTPGMVRNPFLKRSLERDLRIVHGRDVA